MLEIACNDNKNKEMIKITKLVLNNCVQIILLEKASPKITVHQQRGKMKVWRESTTMSPSDKHLDYYKYLFTVINKSPKVEEMKKLKEI